MRLRWHHLAAALLLFSANGYAARNYGMAGCGLGSYVFAPNASGFSQAFAFTTNGTFYSQLGGITSGTSNCEPDAHHAAILNQEQFVSRNLSTLSKEMAQGSGETLMAYSDALGCKRESFGEFSSHIQRSYSQILLAPGAVAVLEATKEEIKKNPRLSASCGELG